MDTIEAMTGRVSPAQLVEPGPTQAQVQAILEAAVSAPDHGRIKPWRFILIEGEARERFGALMADSLQRREPASPEGRLDAERRKAMRAPLIVAVVASPQERPNVPEIEQIVAVAAAAQNMMLAAHGLGLGAFWRTGALAYDDEVKRQLGIAPADRIIGFIYIGTIGMPGRPRELDLASVVRHW